MRVSNMDIDRIYINGLKRDGDYKMSNNHFHYYYEMFYVKNGGVRIFINNELYELRSGDFIVIAPGEAHNVRYFLPTYRINIYFKSEDIMDKSLAALEQFDLRNTGCIHVPGTYRKSVESVFERMLSEDRADDSYTKYMLRCELLELFILLQRFRVKASDLAARGDSEDAVMLDIAKYISEHYESPITLDGLAARAGLSPSYFSRKFKNVTGMGMKEYLKYTRLRNSAHMLVSTPDSITDIAFACGFSDSNYFKDAFKKMYGVSPREYRKQMTTDYLMKESLKKTEAAKREKRLSGSSK